MQNNIEDIEKFIKNNEKKLQIILCFDKNMTEIDLITKNYSILLEKNKLVIENIIDLGEEKIKKEKEFSYQNSEIELKLKANKSLDEYNSQYEENLNKNFEIVSEECRNLKKKFDKENKNFSDLNEAIKHQLLMCKKIEKIVI